MDWFKWFDEHYSNYTYEELVKMQNTTPDDSPDNHALKYWLTDRIKELKENKK